MKRFFLALLLSTACFAQAGWPSYHGDYSGRRYSPLTKINSDNVQSMTLAWMYRTGGGAGSLKSTPLQVDGVLYFSAPDHVWAVYARAGKELWHFVWPSKGGEHIGNRGVGILGDSLYVETPDCNLISLNIRDGKERWHVPNCDLDKFYYGSMAPIIIQTGAGNHVIAGVSGDDLDTPGYLSSYDPKTGALQWRWYAVPQKKGDPGSETWPNEEVMKHGGGMTWQPPTYDPELNLLYVTTGNPQPVIAHSTRAGANLFTASIVALNTDTGKMAWYFQASPHDTHDWDATQVPVLFDDGPRKLLALAARNGYFFVLDRATGRNILSTPYVPVNWSKGVDKNGQPVPDPAKMPQVAGALVSPNQGGATNWPPPTFSPQTGLFYVNASRAFSVYYLFDAGPEPQGWGGNDRGGGSLGSWVEAIDYKTGQIRWIHKWESGSRSGLMSTAGNLVFAGDGSNNFVALNAATGEPLWHAGLGAAVGNGPITYELDGRQYVVVAAGDALWAFVMLPK